MSAATDHTNASPPSSTDTPSIDTPSIDTGSSGVSVVTEASATALQQSVVTSDGVIDAPTHVAGETAEGSTTPEHLMAAALAACLRQAIAIAASTRGVAAPDAQVSARVTLTSGVEAGYTASFALTVGGLPGDDAQAILDQARQLCPFTKALGGADLVVELAT